jgi:TonB family protein
MRIVLRHELAHIGRQDWLVQMCAEVLRTVYWFDPLMWIACARLRRESEQACDDEVLGMGVASHAYAAQLLEIVRASRWPSTGSRAATRVVAPSTLERRIAAMLNPSVNRTAPSRLVVTAAAALVLAIALPISALRAAQTAPLPLEGFIYDASGAILPQVKVTLEDAQRATVETETDATGHFEFASVAPGRYMLEAAVPGFRSLRQELQLRDARDWDRAITLQVGEVTETVAVRATRTAGAAARAQGPVPVRVGGNIRPPRKLEHVNPVYPPTMRESGREGIVPMEAVIDRNGEVQSVRVLSATIHPDFAVAATAAVRQWRFAPTLLNGTPVEVRMTVTIRFSLED